MMIRSVRVLVLALLAPFGLGLVSPGPAFAQQGILDPDGPLTLVGTQTGEPIANAATVPIGKVTCPGATYTGHKYDATPHELLQSGATTITVSADYEEADCVTQVPILGARPTTVSMNECDYVLHIGNTDPKENEEGTYAATTDVACPKGQQIEIHIFKNTSTEHLTEDTICTIKFGSEGNQGLEGLHLTQEDEEDLELSGAAENIHIENSGSLCGTGTSKTSDFDLSLTFEGYNQTGEPTPVGGPQPPQQGILDPDGPLTLVGTQTGEPIANAATVPIGKVTCPGATYTGHKYDATPHELLQSGATTITVSADYEEADCVTQVPILGARPTTVSMNECDYVLHIGQTDPKENEEGTYAATTDVVCPEGGQIEIHIYKSTSTEHLAGDTICTIKLGSEGNQGLEGLHLIQVGSEDLELSGTAENVHTESSGSLCGTGTSETADLDLSLIFEGYNPQGVISTSEPVTLTGTQAGVLLNNATTSALGTATCSGSMFTGHKLDATPHGLVESGATEITLTPHYANCQTHIPVLGTRSFTITMNGCDYVLHIGDKIDETPRRYAVTTDIVCPEGKVIETHLYGSPEHLSAESTCTYKFGPQKGLSGLQLRHTEGEGDDVDLIGTLSGIHEEHSGPLCAKGTSKTGTTHFSLTIAGHNELGEGISVTVADQGEEEGVPLTDG